MGLEVLILSRVNAIEVSNIRMKAGLPKPYIISMTDVMSANPNFPYYEKVLSLKFNDHVHDRPTAPQLEHAIAIVDFVQSLPEDVDLFSHCEAGMCRSSAAAIAAYSIKLGVPAAKEYFQPYYGKIWPNQRLVKLIEQIAVERNLLTVGELSDLAEWINYYPMAGQEDLEHE